MTLNASPKNTVSQPRTQRNMVYALATIITIGIWPSLTASLPITFSWRTRRSLFSGRPMYFGSHAPVSILRASWRRSVHAEKRCTLKTGISPTAKSALFFLPAGAGDVDLLAAAKSANHAEYIAVELDEYAGDMLAAVKQSYEYLTVNGIAQGNL